MDKSSIVIEIGGRYTKCGYSPESSPRFIIPTNLLPLDISTYLSSGTSFDKSNHPNNEIKQPQPTSTQLKESLFIFFKSLFLNYLLCKADERKIIIVENIFLPRLFRESMVSVLFELYRVPLIVFINPTASLIPTLRTTSLIIDCGYAETRVLPIYEGIGILKAFETVSLGSETLIRELKQILLNQQQTEGSADGTGTGGIILNNQNNTICTDQTISLNLINSLDINTLEDIITKCCICSFTNKSNSEGAPAEVNNINYRLSKEYSIIINGELVRSGLIGKLYKSMDEIEEQDGISSYEEGNIATTILDCLMKCEHDQRKPLTHNILLIGGTSMIPGFKKRLVRELHKHLLNDQLGYKNEIGGLVNHFQFINHPFENNYLTWLGGSILATALEHVYDKITLESYMNAPSIAKRSQLIPEWESLTSINNYTQIAQSTISTTVNPLQFNSSASLFSPFTSSSDLSNYLKK